MKPRLGSVFIPHGATVPSSDGEVETLQEQEASKGKKTANSLALIRQRALHVRVIISKNKFYPQITFKEMTPNRKINRIIKIRVKLQLVTLFIRLFGLVRKIETLFGHIKYDREGTLGSKLGID